MDALPLADRLMRKQHGVISRQQALTRGITAGQIRHKLQTRAWVTLSSGVYAAASSVPSWERQLVAAQLAHPGSLVAGRSAARLHGFLGASEGRPEVLAPFGANARSDIARVIRSRHFDSVETIRVAGFRSTTVAETILTLSLRDHPSLIERHIDHEIARRKLSVRDFDPILDRLAFARQRGLGSLRRLVRARSDDSYVPPTNELERLLYRLLDRKELPEYSRQAPMGYRTVDATVDAFIDSWLAVVEADGRRWHTRKEDFERDRARDNEALAAGLVVVRFTWQMLRYHPEDCLNTLLEIGRRRSAA